jgi:hypothetical protein
MQTWSSELVLDRLNDSKYGSLIGTARRAWTMLSFEKEYEKCMRAMIDSEPTEMIATLKTNVLNEFQKATEASPDHHIDMCHIFMLVASGVNVPEETIHKDLRVQLDSKTANVTHPYGVAEGDCLKFELPTRLGRSQMPFFHAMYSKYIQIAITGGLSTESGDTHMSTYYISIARLQLHKIPFKKTEIGVYEMHYNLMLPYFASDDIKPVDKADDRLVRLLKEHNVNPSTTYVLYKQHVYIQPTGMYKSSIAQHLFRKESYIQFKASKNDMNLLENILRLFMHAFPHEEHKSILDVLPGVEVPKRPWWYNTWFLRSGDSPVAFMVGALFLVGVNDVFKNGPLTLSDRHSINSFGELCELFTNQTCNELHKIFKPELHHDDRWYVLPNVDQNGGQITFTDNNPMFCWTRSPACAVMRVPGKSFTQNHIFVHYLEQPPPEGTTLPNQELPNVLPDPERTQGLEEPLPEKTTPIPDWVQELRANNWYPTDQDSFAYDRSHYDHWITMRSLRDTERHKYLKLSNTTDKIPNEHFKGCHSLVLTDLPNSLRHIKEYAFADCFSLALTTLSDDLEHIGNYAFQNCTSLALTKLPEKLISIGRQAFEHCTSLALKKLPPGVKTIEEATFRWCTWLRLTKLSEELTSIEPNAFESCRYLALENLPPNVVSIKNAAFKSCTSLSLTELPAGITIIDVEAFYLCTSLALRELPKNLTTIRGNAFEFCTSLALETLPNGVETIDSAAFSNCKSLRLAELPARIQTIETSTFQGCSSLALTKLPEGLLEIGNNSFSGCQSLALTKLSDELKYIRKYAFEGCKLMPLTELPESLLIIEEHAFEHCDTLNINKLPTGIEIVQPFTFHQCHSLALVTLSERLKRIEENAFKHCAILELSELPTGLTFVGESAFEECTTLNLTHLSTNLEHIGRRAFCGCKNLSLIELPPNLEHIGPSAFAYCKLLALRELPAGITTVNNHTFYECENLALTTLPVNLNFIGFEAFAGCTNLQLVELPATIKNVVSRAFADCTSLSLTNLPEDCIQIGEETFTGCTALSLESLPANLKHIGEYAFSGCTSLSLTALPEGLITIGVGAFENCTSLNITELPAGLLVLGEDAFKGCTSMKSTPTKAISRDEALRRCNLLRSKNIVERDIPSGEDERRYFCDQVRGQVALLHEDKHINSDPNDMCDQLRRELSIISIEKFKECNILKKSSVEKRTGQGQRPTAPKGPSSSLIRFEDLEA